LDYIEDETIRFHHRFNVPLKSPVAMTLFSNADAEKVADFMACGLVTCIKNKSIMVI